MAAGSILDDIVLGGQHGQDELSLAIRFIETEFVPLSAVTWTLCLLLVVPARGCVL
jgi:hypothetical protein